MTEHADRVTDVDPVHEGARSCEAQKESPPGGVDEVCGRSVRFTSTALDKEVRRMRTAIHQRGAPVKKQLPKLDPEAYAT